MSNIVKRENSGAISTIPPSNPPAVSGEAEGFDLRQIIASLYRRKFQIALVALLVTIPVGVSTYLATPLYRSTLLLQIDPEPARVLPYQDVTDIVTGARDYELYMTTQDQILRSPTLAERVISRMKQKRAHASAPDVREIPSGLEVLRIPNSQLIALAYVASEPQLAADIVNSYGEEYIREHFEAKKATRDKATAFLEKELSELKRKLEMSEKEVIQYGQAKNLDTEDLVKKKLEFVSQEVSNRESELITAQSRLQRLQEASLAKFPTELMTPNITSLQSKLLQAEQDLTDLLTRFDDNWPDVKHKREEIRFVKEQLEREKQRLLDEAIEQAQADYRAIERRYERMTKSRAEQEALAERLNEASVQANILKREAETNQQMYNALMERLKQTSVTAGLEFGNIHVVEAGKPDYAVYSPRVRWNLSLGLLFGLAIGVCLAFVLDFWDRTISTVQQLEEKMAIPALGAVPFVPALAANGYRKGFLRRGEAAQSKSLALTPARHHKDATLTPAAREAFRGLCASILLSDSAVPRTILVTSAVPGEGKTTLVEHLGKAFAESGARTVIVELDMRKPKLSSRFQQEPVDGTHGASLFLAGHGAKGSAPIVATATANLFLLPAGPKPPNPIALLSSDRLTELLAHLKSEFRFVLIDSPPILTVADARVIGPKVDGVVLVARVKQTPRELIDRARTQILSAGGRMLGCTLNGVESQHDFYPYYNRYFNDSYYTS
ncbi:MAG: GumC family protein [Acidobacteriota bacterium]